LKKIAVLVLLFLFLLQCGIKTIIVVGFYTQRDLISKTICENKNKPKMHCNGKCYLNKQLKKEQKNERDTSNILKEVNEIFVKQPISDFEFISFDQILEHYDNYLIRPYQNNIPNIFRPPLTAC
jgi:thioredoxin-related protein